MLINGKPYGRIKPNRGIRQGDSISPFMFILSMDYLSSLLNFLQEQRAIKGIEINCRRLTNHILFVDDILNFIEENDSSIRNFQMAISIFEKASRLSINRKKSSHTPINVAKDRIINFINIWDIRCQPLPINYLGVPLKGKPRTKGL